MILRLLGLLLSRPASPTISRHIPAAMRRRVIARDGRICVYCGEPVDDDLELHHVLPFRYFTSGVVESLGSPHQAWNLVVTCRDCNRRISDSLGIWPGARPTRWPGLIRLLVKELLRL